MTTRVSRTVNMIPYYDNVHAYDSDSIYVLYTTIGNRWITNEEKYDEMMIWNEGRYYGKAPNKEAIRTENIFSDNYYNNYSLNKRRTYVYIIYIF